MATNWKPWIQKKVAEDPLYWVKLGLRRRYGITLEQLHQMERQQKGVCAICLEKPKQGRLVVDHDHKTGKIRGLLCRSCNYCLGAFDDLAVAERLVEYLAR